MIHFVERPVSRRFVLETRQSERNMHFQPNLTVTRPLAIAPSSLLPALSKLLDDANGALEHDNAVARSCLAQALTLLRQQKLPADDTDAPAPSTPIRSGLAPWQILRVKAYVEEHLDGPVRVADLASLSRLSVSYFSVAFQRSFGTSLSVFLARLRVERAQAMMQSTDQKLSQIALACGFCDQAHLSRQFRRVVGSTPRRWRQEHAMQAAA
jgi:AraC family transcriptional regulator